jgi:hypothetical protein
MMRVERCTNLGCLRPYQVNEFDFRDPATGRDVGHITCPHCGQMQIGFGSSTVLVHALTAEQEKEFNRTYPLRRCARSGRAR